MSISVGFFGSHAAEHRSILSDAIDVRNLWQARGVRWILKDLSFQVQRDEIAVLTGVNGVGKTTLLTTIAGMHSPVKGRVSVFGRARRETLEGELEASRQTVFLPDEAWLPNGLTEARHHC